MQRSSSVYIAHTYFYVFVFANIGPVHVQGREKQGKSRRRVQRGVWCWRWCSSGLCPQPASLHHRVRGSIQGVPYRLSMGAADLMISAESMEELLVKLKTWKSEMEKKCV